MGCRHSASPRRSPGPKSPPQQCHFRVGELSPMSRVLSCCSIGCANVSPRESLSFVVIPSIPVLFVLENHSRGSHVLAHLDHSCGSLSLSSFDCFLLLFECVIPLLITPVVAGHCPSTCKKVVRVRVWRVVPQHSPEFFPSVPWGGGTLSTCPHFDSGGG